MSEEKREDIGGVSHARSCKERERERERDRERQRVHMKR